MTPSRIPQLFLFLGSEVYRWFEMCIWLSSKLVNAYDIFWILLEISGVSRNKMLLRSAETLRNYNIFHNTWPFKGVRFDFLRIWRPSCSKLGWLSTLSILDMKTMTTDKGARMKKGGPKIDLLALQQLEICKSQLWRTQKSRNIVRFSCLIASFLAFFKTNTNCYFSNSRRFFSLVRWIYWNSTWK